MSVELRELECILRCADPHLLIGRGIIDNVYEWIKLNRDSILMHEANHEFLSYKLAVEEAERLRQVEKKKNHTTKQVYVQKGDRRGSR